MHQRREPLVTVQGESFLTVADETCVARLDRHVGALMLISVEVKVFQFAHERVKDHRKFRKPFHILNAGDFRRLFLGQLMALPDGQMLVRLTHEKNFAMIRVESIWRE